MTINERVSQRIKYLRTIKNMNQYQLAKKANISQSTIAQIETGKKSFSICTLEKISKALNSHISDFFNEKLTINI